MIRIPAVTSPAGSDLPTTERHAEAFEQIRSAHQTETAEDYVELIADLIDAHGEARLVDLAGRFGVSHPTAKKILDRLQREGLVTSRPYRSIFLTDKGRALAHYCKRRHQVVLAFLKAIGVSERNAEIDAEGVEHHVSDETLQAFERFITKNAGG
ncbi:MAG TPA: manganese-binding transcriptional regulator MntR [Alphaproteobacteria bacterium]|nr:manganese-binding transcriptional regulator MntR [Alphaproteobacteria bacterium]